MTVTDIAAACPVCGEPIAAGDLFCEACGNALPVTESPAVEPPPAPAVATVTCPSCGNQGEPVEGYCGVCGTRLPAPRDHQELVLEGAAGVCDKGKRHARNEDAMAAFVGDGYVAAVVCDGVSTSVDPDIASQAAAITDTLVTLASLGDCRAYWYSDGTATQLTVDDSWAEVQIAAGTPPADAYSHALAHVITRWLSNDADPEWRPRIVPFDVPGPGRLLLVSDGLWNYTLEPAHLVGAMGDPASERIELARRLVTFANDAGGSDNITVVVVDLPLKGSPTP